MNNKYTIKLEAPLIRAGLSITTETSERYVVPVLNKMMELVRDFNSPNPNAPEVAPKYSVTYRNSKDEEENPLQLD
jgi:hypothetical protein